MKIITMEKLSILIFVFISLKLNAQPIDCEPILDYRQPDPSFIRNENSKSVQAFTGEKYEFMVPVKTGEQYRFTFFVSAVLTRKIQFKIEDIESAEVLMNLPGMTKESRRNECVLVPYYDQMDEKMIYPYFDFFPKQPTTYKVTIDIAPYKRPKLRVPTDNIEAEDSEQKEVAKFTAPEEKITGCVTMYIQQRNICY